MWPGRTTKFAWPKRPPVNCFCCGRFMKRRQMYSWYCLSCDVQLDNDGAGPPVLPKLFAYSSLGGHVTEAYVDHSLVHVPAPA